MEGILKIREVVEKDSTNVMPNDADRGSLDIRAIR
jgi:hypothetical protein